MDSSHWLSLTTIAGEHRESRRLARFLAGAARVDMQAAARDDHDAAAAEVLDYMGPRERREFGDYVEDCKRTGPGMDIYTVCELLGGRFEFARTSPLIQRGSKPERDPDRQLSATKASGHAGCIPVSALREVGKKLKKVRYHGDDQPPFALNTDAAWLAIALLQEHRAHEAKSWIEEADRFLRARVTGGRPELEQPPPEALNFWAWCRLLIPWRAAQALLTDSRFPADPFAD